MALHLVKLCVGADTLDDLVAWHDQQAFARLSQGLDPRPVCNTRMSPKRREALLDGGSLYWVIKGVVQVRQEIVDIVTLGEEGGRSRCEIILKHHHIRTAPLRRKAFQGWRYLEGSDAPADLTEAVGGTDLPDALRQELIEIGAW